MIAIAPNSNGYCKDYITKYPAQCLVREALINIINVSLYLLTLELHFTIPFQYTQIHTIILKRNIREKIIVKEEINFLSETSKWILDLQTLSVLCDY